MPTPEREAARAAGEPFYFTGKPCKNGHIAKRRTASGHCSRCAYEATRRSITRIPGLEAAKKREDRRRNPATAKAIAKRYRERHPEEVARRNKEWRENNREKNRETHRRWRLNNPDKMRAIAQRQRAKDPAKARAAVAASMAKNPSIRRAALINRRTRLRNNGGKVTSTQIAALFDRQKGRCAECGKKRKLVVDHIMPIKLGGTSDIGNLQLLCGPCNQAKWAIDPIVWAQRRGRLL